MDKVLSEISMLPPGDYKTNMMKHLNSMCILTLLKYGSKTPKLEYVLRESFPKWAMIHLNQQKKLMKRPIS